MEKKAKPSTESMRKKRGSLRRQDYGGVLEGSRLVNFSIKEERYQSLKAKALQEEKGVSQVLRELVEDYLKQN